jgi:large subunit ribosomal protein LP0
VGYPTQASLPHSIGNAFKTLVAIGVNLDSFSFKEVAPFKAFLADPSAFAVAGPAAAAGGAAAAPAAAKAPEKPKEEEVDALDGGMDMFGGGGGAKGDY